MHDQPFGPERHEIFGIQPGERAALVGLLDRR